MTGRADSRNSSKFAPNTAVMEDIKPCYLDSAETIPVPDLYAYNGVPQSQPMPIIGSHEFLGLKSDICFDRYGRYGPYGLGYGDYGTSKSNKRDKHARNETSNIADVTVDWGKAQARCYRTNQHRFGSGNETRERQAIIIRTYTGFRWTPYAIMNVRALASESSLKSGGEYDVHLLLQVKDNKIPIWDDGSSHQRILDRHVPREFHSLCSLWSEAQMRQYYPGKFGKSRDNPSGRDIHGVYRSGHMPLQRFAVEHPEYAYFWNWEADIRYIGSYYELFSQTGKWARKQSREMIWERSSLYYIPAFHGTWTNFSDQVDRDMLLRARQPVRGPVDRPVEFASEDFLPKSCRDDKNFSHCGIGEAADLITFNPIFDAQGSGWVFSKDITGYGSKKTPIPSRRSTIVAAGRLSRRLLHVMHEETLIMHHTMFTEMFPPTMALHHGLKAVYAPHPMYMERAWPVDKVNSVFNGGRDGTPGGPKSPFKQSNEGCHKGTTWYYDAEFAGALWRLWLGLHEREENANAAADGSSRLCLRSMLFHPIKWEEP